ncbi:hypothetical protein [Glutamicibacter protophormiae]|uniref:DUF4149 domain-containing protein n=1 Tax=Glutamicibacter protophormiae TaxID=37930 RepID=A0ABS4XKY5_GLUPR|nr:hypothetical protein [Glutamicibacter protophormiae]MBP2397154.1 hypothetical protein [Glutamicibacter protophormiae]QRQ77960.1 hypothetical protein JQN66_13700 [Glutamicibacter protophormiae]GGM01772.1 hypothetical protein GCM10010038_34850 [Glutamicibacter protophormiae]
MSPSTLHAPTRAALWAAAARILAPALWLGLVVGISFIEAPLKFTAPGITIPLGLGIGRLVFFAMNIVEILLFIALLLGTIKRGTDKAWKWGVGVAGFVLMLKTAAIRPGLSRRTDAVLSGNFEGGSLWHYAYIGAEGALTVTLVVLLVLAVRRWVSISAR